jgi:hypothetical protein
MVTTTSLSKEQRLESICQHQIDNYSAFLKALSEGRSNERFSSMALWGEFERFAIKAFFLDKDLKKAKLCFYRCGILDILLISKYDEKILDYGINHLSYALLSDNQELVTQYANLKHSLYDKMIALGNATPVYIMQCLLKNDWNEFERAMVIMKNKTVPKFKVELDALFYEAMAERNKEKAESVINELLTPKEHKRRNKHHMLLNEFISHPAVGYAKLAWIKGLEVEIQHPLVPKELLPVQPLDSYENAPYHPSLW